MSTKEIMKQLGFELKGEITETKHYIVGIEPKTKYAMAIQDSSTIAEIEQVVEERRKLFGINNKRVKA